jgi:hypothetical protein
MGKTKILLGIALAIFVGAVYYLFSMNLLGETICGCELTSNTLRGIFVYRITSAFGAFLPLITTSVLEYKGRNVTKIRSFLILFHFIVCYILTWYICFTNKKSGSSIDFSELNTQYVAAGLSIVVLTLWLFISSRNRAS